jgi:catechol 2,3-dioxygenase-like lactoylglutathione lyase family enzyme
MTVGAKGIVTGVRTVAVPVKDQDRALRFYVDVLGLNVRMDAPVAAIGGRWIEVAPGDADVSLALVPASDARPGGVETGIRLGTLDAAALHQALSDHGAEVGDLLEWPGVPTMFEFRDPDGNTLVVVE